MELAVVIPTLGRRPDALRRVLEALRRERVVLALDAAAGAVDAGGAQVVRARRPGASAARNAGWRAAGAPVVLFLDDDVVPDPGSVAAHRARHAAEPDERVGVLGSVRWADGLRVTPFMRWLERGVAFDFGSIRGDDAGWGRFYTANASVKTALLQRVGGFDEDGLPFGYEDLDVAKRMAAHGLVVRWAPEASAQHLHASDVAEWQATVARIARAERAFCAKHPDVAPHFLPFFAPFEDHPRPRGRAVRAAHWVPERLPWLGPRVWAGVDRTYRALLAPAFMRAWRA